MEGGLPMLNCLLQHTLRNLCSSQWIYAVFWRILPRNYPPPKWDSEGVMDRSKGNKRNWILVWDDGFCDFCECERVGRSNFNGKFGADVFFKMAHEVYNFGEGLIGKVAADNSHKWIFKEKPIENDANFFSPWNATLDPHPRQWASQFNSGIQTIAVVAVREGVIQLGSLDKVVEDLNLVINIQRKFNYLQSIPGVFAMPRPYIAPHNGSAMGLINNQLRDIAGFDFVDDKQESRTAQLLLRKRSYNQQIQQSPSKWMKLGCDIPPLKESCWSIPPLFPSMTYSLGALLSKLPGVMPQHSQENLTHPTNKLSLSSINMVECKQEIKEAEIPILSSSYGMEDQIAELNFQSQGDESMERETSHAATNFIQ